MKNIAKILKNCLKGTELYSPLYGVVKLKGVRFNNYYALIDVINSDGNTETFYGDGRYYDEFPDSECLLFPSKENRDWDKFSPFKAGDIIYTCCKSTNTFISIFKEIQGENLLTYCDLGSGFHTRENNVLCGVDDIKEQRLATEEETYDLFNAIKHLGHKWNAETKTLEKLHQFKSGDVLVSCGGNIVLCSHIDDKQVIHYHCILKAPFGNLEVRNDTGVGKESDCTLANEYQKQKLFDKLNSKGYVYNPETNKLERLIELKFKVGDVVSNGKTDMIGIINLIIYEKREYQVALKKGGITYIRFEHQDKWELAPHKFNISNLRPFAEVLVRDYDEQKWVISFYGFCDDEVNAYKYSCMNGSRYTQCIPYKGNEHLRGTNNTCDEFYKTW